MHALDGLRVLDLSRLLPGPMAAMYLADFGAEVIKVEEPVRGDYWRDFPPKGAGGDSYYFLLSNRNKKSVALNLKDPRGVEAFRRLARTADILIEGFRPDVMQRLGLGYEALSADNPRLIYCALTGYGQTGPYAQMAGHDVNYLALSGVLSLTRAGDVPVVQEAPIADIGAGSLMAVIGILLAVAARERTGRGQFVDVAMLDGSVAWLLSKTHWHFAGLPTPKSRFRPRYNVYRTSDDKFISVGCLEPQFWARLCQVLELPELVAEREPEGARAVEIAELLQARFAERTREEWFQRLREADTCGAPVLEVEEVWEDPHVRARGMLAEVEDPVYGKILQVGIPIKLSDTPGEIRSAPPRLGEHTASVLGSVGYTAMEMEALRAEGVIK